jgi:sterol desaturase/sphingolipid hydroxylase (fatty acid hydroxylase superfamily)
MLTGSCNMIYSCSFNFLFIFSTCSAIFTTMETFIDLCNSVLPLHKLLWVFLCLGAAWLVESVIPLSQAQYNRRKHAGVNFVFFAFSMVINLVLGLTVVAGFEYLSVQEFGLFYLLELPLWGQLVLTILFLDLVAQYFVHYLLHKVRWMWRLHVVHHSDTRVDATTGVRHHPVDFFIRESFALVAILLLGAPLAFYVFYRLLSILFTFWTHANIKLPGKLDYLLSWIIVTPNMHKFHHHHELPWTDSNFGNVLSVWDRLFGTLVYEDPEDVMFGLDVVDETKDEDVLYQLTVPFSSDPLRNE